MAPTDDTQPTATAEAQPAAAAPTPVPPAPAYGQIRARIPYRWGDRRLAAGEVVMDLRSPGGAAALKTFKDHLRWSAFEVVEVDGPAPVACSAATVENRPPSLGALADLIAALPAAALADLPGLGAKSVAKLQEWAIATATSPLPPV